MRYGPPPIAAVQTCGAELQPAAEALAERIVVTGEQIVELGSDVVVRFGSEPPLRRSIVENFSVTRHQRTQLDQGAGTDVGDHLGGRDRPQAPPQRRNGCPAVQPVEESRRVEIPCAGRVDHPVHPFRGHFNCVAGGHDHRTLRADGDRGELAVTARSSITASREGLGSRTGEMSSASLPNSRSTLIADEIAEVVAVAVNAERVGQCERDLSAGLVSLTRAACRNAAFAS